MTEHRDSYRPLPVWRRRPCRADPTNSGADSGVCPEPAN